MSAVHPSSAHGNSSWPQTVAYSTATWGGGMSVAPQLIDGGRAQSLNCSILTLLNVLAYAPALATLGSELRGTPSMRSSLCSIAPPRTESYVSRAIRL